jgi:ubiquinone/menaquinone biosynthesis C-methylase UbiE
MTTDFDKYASEYREIINDVSRISGERYEYFINLRIGLMKEKVAGKLPNLHILDFGCGIGTTEIFLKKAFPHAEIWGVDSSPASIEAAQGLELPNVTFLVQNAGTLPFTNGHFDLIYSNGTFHHIERERHAEVVRELSRVLQKEGELFIFENNPCNPFMMRAMVKNPFDRGATALAPSYLGKALKDTGFRVDAVNYYFFFPRCLSLLRVAEKYLRWLRMGAQYFIWATKTHEDRG